MGKKLTYELIKGYFKEQSCEMLEKEYENANTPMRYKCRCGHISQTTFGNFKRYQKCKKCAVKTISEKNRYSFNFVYNYFKKRDCELLEKKYKNVNTKMRYICGCGDISEISFDCFKRGHRCNECRIKKISGAKCYLWNPDLSDEERDYSKNRQNNPLYKKWRRQVYKKDNYTCQKCSKKGYKLNAHHIESWASNEDLRLVVSNGTVFCEDCHKIFHKIYGKKSNNQQQLIQFLK